MKHLKCFVLAFLLLGYNELIPKSKIIELYHGFHGDEKGISFIASVNISTLQSKKEVEVSISTEIVNLHY